MEVTMRNIRLFTLLIMLFAAGCGTNSQASTIPPSETIAPKAVPTDTRASTKEILPSATRTPAPGLIIIQVIDDFEVPKTDWIAGMEPEYTDSNSTSAVLSMEHPSQGTQSLELAFESNDKPKAIFYVDRPLDLSKAREIQFDIFNPATAGGVGVAFLTGPEQVWQESDSLPVRAGKTNTLTFDLTASNYKTAATGWEFTASLTGLNQVTRLAIIVYPSTSGSVYLDNIVLLGAP
jgi:hypothetical protein